MRSLQTGYPFFLVLPFKKVHIVSSLELLFFDPDGWQYLKSAILGRFFLAMSCRTSL
jgi:hypothetical protein